MKVPSSTEALWQEPQPDEVKELVHALLTNLDEILQERPSAQGDLMAICKESLADPLDADSWQRLADNLKAYLESNSGDLLTWIVVGDITQRLNQVEQYGSDRAAVLLRTLAATFGTRVLRAVRFSNGWVDDWEYMDTSVYYDEGVDRFNLRVRLRKNNDEQILIEGSPDSLLDLTRNLMNLLHSVGSQDAFSESARGAFVGSAEEMLHLLKNAVESESREGIAELQRVEPGGVPASES